MFACMLAALESEDDRNFVEQLYLENYGAMYRKTRSILKSHADAEDAVRWAYASDLLTEKDGKLRVQEELSRKELSRMLEDLLALSSAD